MFVTVSTLVVVFAAAGSVLEFFGNRDWSELTNRALWFSMGVIALYLALLIKGY